MSFDVYHSQPFPERRKPREAKQKKGTHAHPRRLYVAPFCTYVAAGIFLASTLLGPQFRLGDKLLQIRVRYLHVAALYSGAAL